MLCQHLLLLSKSGGTSVRSMACFCWVLIRTSGRDAFQNTDNIYLTDSVSSEHVSCDCRHHLLPAPSSHCCLSVWLTC